MAVLEISGLCQSGRMRLNRESVGSSGGRGAQQVSQLGRDGRRGHVAPLPAAVLLAPVWHRGPLRGQQGQGQPCPWEGLPAESEQEASLSHLSLAAAVTSQPSATHAATLCILLPASWSGEPSVLP